MEIHHQKHHQTYITNLNAALTAQSGALQSQDVPQLISLQQKIKFNGGGHINHSLFWKNLTPASSPQAKLESAPGVKAAIERKWGSYEGFQKVFSATLLGIQGSGWGWLVANKPKGELEIVTTKDQDPVTGDTPLFGVDMWEHAYYLQVSFFLSLSLYSLHVDANDVLVVPEQQGLLRRRYLEDHQLVYCGGPVPERH